jgi:LacI family transcriptional regulator
VEYTARKSGYHLLLSGMETDQSYLHIARNRGVDGIIIVGTYPSRNLDELHQTGIPVVLVDTYIQDSPFHTIGINDREGGRMATDYLLGKGHRRIAFVSGSIQEHGVNAKRYQGYLEALEQAGIAASPRWVYSGNVDFAYGVQAAREMAERGSEETAAFVTADVLGMGLVKGLNQMGKELPKDLSIVSFDDVYLAQMTEPSLTTVHQDITAKGENAVRMIIQAATGDIREKQEMILPIEIVERESVLDLNRGNA